LLAGFIWVKVPLIALYFSDMIGDFGANHSLSRASDFEQRILFRAAQNTTCYLPEANKSSLNSRILPHCH